MKFQVVFLAFAALCATSNALPAFGKGPLYDDIMYFTDMIPIEKIGTITVRYMAQDKEFQELLKYMKTDDFKQMVTEIEAIPEFHVFIQYMEKNGVYLSDVLTKVNKFLGLPAFQPMDLFKTDGLKGYFEAVKAEVSYDSIIHGYVYKMRHSESWRGFVAHLKSGNHQQFIDKLYQNQRFLNFRQMIQSKGIDIVLIEDVLYTVLGMTFPEFKFEAVTFAESDLAKDIHDFLDLIDKDKILAVVAKYLDDDEVHNVLTYFYSEDFHVLVREVEAVPEYQKLVLYLQDAGLDVVSYIQKFHKLVDMEEYVPPKHPALFAETYANRGGLKKMLDEIIALLPEDKIKALYQEKMANSPAFQKFIEKLRAPEFKDIVNTIYASPVFLKMRKAALDAGLDLDQVKELLKKVIGLDVPKVPPY